MRPIRVLLAALLAAPVASVALAQEAPPRPRVALALSGGGARGIAHVGALRALEEAGVPVDAIVANSMGAVVGGVYATGRSAAELEEIVRSMDWASLFSGRPDRRTLPVDQRVDRYAPVAGVNFDWRSARLPSGLLAEHRVNRFLVEHLSPAGFRADGDFDRLAIPFRAMAGDLATGEPVVLAKGDLARAVRASMSIPLAFPPVEWEGRKLVDGMIVNNLPIDVAKSFGASVVVAVDIGSPRLEAVDYVSAIGVAAQVSDLLMRRRQQDYAAEADVLVVPDLGKHSATDYSGFDELIAKGYEAAKAALPQIRAKLEAAGLALPAGRRPAPAGPSLEGARIAAVRVEGSGRVREALTRRTFNVPTDVPFDMDKGLRAYDKIDASPLFERTWLSFRPAAEGVDIVLRVQDAPPNRAEVGFGYTEWEKARGSIRLRNQNTLGFGERVELLLGASDAERVIEASLRGDRLFVTGFGYRVTGYANRDKPRFFDVDGTEINRARFERDGVELALRTGVKRWGLFEGGARFGRVKTSLRSGLEDLLPEQDDQVGLVFGRVVFDTLDDLAWPEHGRRFAVSGEWSLSDLGADREYWKAQADVRAAHGLGRRVTLQLDASGFLSGREGELPVYEWYRLGGVTLVPGYRHEELKGPQAFAAAASLRARLLGQLRLVVRGGAGNVFATTGDVTLDGLRWGVSAGAYHPSPIGPVSFDFAVRDGGATLAQVSIGWP
jgi:NTE family protein